MLLPKSWTTVTPFSKKVALLLFIALPLVTFYLGLRYNPYKTPAEIDNKIYDRILPSEKMVGSPTTTTPNSQIRSTNDCLDNQGVIRRNIELCSENPICDKLGSYEDRFCRLPDGSCKFFCDGK